MGKNRLESTEAITEAEEGQGVREFLHYETFFPMVLPVNAHLESHSREQAPQKYLKIAI